MHLKAVNLNPWGMKIGDCAVRAVSAALWMKYPAVCEFFGKKCVRGYGLAGREGIGLQDIKDSLGKFFDRIEDANEIDWSARPREFDDLRFDPAFDMSPDLGLTLDEFCDVYAGTGRYLVALVHNVSPSEMSPERNRDGHIVYADLRPGKGFFLDTWNSGIMVVQAYMRIRAILDRKDPRSLYASGKKVLSF